MHLGVPRRLNKPLAGLRQPPCYESMAAMESAELIVSDKREGEDGKPHRAWRCAAGVPVTPNRGRSDHVFQEEAGA